MRTLRLSKHEYSLVNKTGIGDKHVNISSSIRLLRPCDIASKSEEITNDSGMRLVDKEAMVDAWNSTFFCHTEHSPDCKIPVLLYARKKSGA